MADVFSKSKRSAVMARIRGSGNRSTELRLVRLFRRNGIKGWRRQSRLEGRPDFIFQKVRLVIFVDGCFWHGCPIHGTQPRNNAAFWSTKIARNQARDRTVTRVLKREGWGVVRIWEHDLTAKREMRLVSRLIHRHGLSSI